VSSAVRRTEKKSLGDFAPGPTSFETRVKRKTYSSSAKCRRVKVARLTSPAPNSISERGGLGALSGKNAEDINVTERTNMKPLKALENISVVPLTSTKSNRIA
jgi:hypothetical protein